MANITRTHLMTSDNHILCGAGQMHVVAVKGAAEFAARVDACGRCLAALSKGKAAQAPQAPRAERPLPKRLVKVLALVTAGPVETASDFLAYSDCRELAERGLVTQTGTLFTLA